MKPGGRSSITMAIQYSLWNTMGRLTMYQHCQEKLTKVSKITEYNINTEIISCKSERYRTKHEVADYNKKGPLHLIK